MIWSSISSYFIKDPFYVMLLYAEKRLHQNFSFVLWIVPLCRMRKDRGAPCFYFHFLLRNKVVHIRILAYEELFSPQKSLLSVIVLLCFDKLQHYCFYFIILYNIFFIVFLLYLLCSCRLYNTKFVPSFVKTLQKKSWTLMLHDLF